MVFVSSSNHTLPSPSPTPLFVSCPSFIIPNGNKSSCIASNCSLYNIFFISISDIDWNKSGEEAIKDYKKGDFVKAGVSEIDVEKERISLSIKMLGSDQFVEAVDGIKRGAVITVEVTSIEEGGIEVNFNGMKSFIRRSDLSRDRSEQRPDKFSVGDKIDARVTSIDSKSRKLGLSIKAREIAEEKEAVEQYGSTDSGASLGDILGAALKDQDEK